MSFETIDRSYHSDTIESSVLPLCRCRGFLPAERATVVVRHDRGGRALAREWACQVVSPVPVTRELERVQDAYDPHTVTEQRTDGDGGIDTEEWDVAAPDEPHPSERG